MSIRLLFASVIAVSLLTAVSAPGAEPLGTAFTYQGQLKQAGVPLSDYADFRLSVWNAGVGGADDGTSMIDPARAPTPDPTELDRTDGGTNPTAGDIADLHAEIGALRARLAELDERIRTYANDQ